MGTKNRVSLNIKNPEVYHAAARLAKLEGTTITTAVLNALRAQLARDEHRKRPPDEVARMKEFARRVTALPVVDDRSEDAILGYGPGGYPDGD